MTTEVDERSEYNDDDDDDTTSVSEVNIKCDESSSTSSTPAPTTLLSTPSTPLTTWPYSALLTPQSIISPSQLVLTDLITPATSTIKRPSPSSPSASSSSAEPPAKKAKRKARTDEEKEARAHERTMRNRRAAQESRDRKKRQFEVLEEENKRLQEENRQMKQRIEQLEQQQQQQQQRFTPPTEYSPRPTEYNTDVIIKSEDQGVIEFSSAENFESTFHPAVMEFSTKDQQCLSIISLNKNLLLLPYFLTTLLFQLQQTWMNLPIFSTLFSLTITRISLMNNGMLTYSPATFNSLNTGSLFTGAENKLCDSLCRRSVKWTHGDSWNEWGTMVSCGI